MRNILLLSVVLFLSFVSKGQELILSDETITESYLLKYENSADHSQQVINYMISEIAKHNKHNRQFDQIIFSFKQITRITRKEKKINIYLTITEFQTESKINYRGFRLNEVLIPSKIDLTGELITKNNKVLSGYSINDADFNANKNLFNFVYTDTTNIKELKFIVKSKNFIYTNQCKTDFNKKLTDIDQYYDVSAKMSMAFDDLSRINPNNIDLLYEYDNIIKNVYRLIDDIESYQLEQKLNLHEFDPQHVLQKLNDLRFETNRQRDIVNYNISILYKIYYNRALEVLVNGDEQLAESLFQKSLYINPLFAPSQLQLAKLDYKNNRLDDASARVKDIFSRMNPDPETANFTMQLVNNIYFAYMDLGDALMNSGSYYQALEAYNKTKGFCVSIPNFSCTDLLLKNISRAKTAIYNTYISNSRNYLNKGDLIAAEKEIRKALDYFNTNQADIGSDSEAIAVLTEIKNQEYIRLIAQGKTFLNAKNYKASFKTFQNAENLETQYNIYRSNELKELLTLSAKPVLLSDIAAGLEAVNQNRIDDAKKVVVTTVNIQNNYNLMGDKEIISQLEHLRKKIFTKECINAQNEFDILLRNIRNHILNKYYLLADKEFENAFALSEKYSNCMIDISEASNLKKEVQAAIDFLKMSVAIDADVKINRFSNAIEAYIAIEKFYSQNKIDANFGLTLLPMVDYIATQSYGFIIYSINYYTNNKSYDHALKLMDALKSRSTASKEVKNEQKKLGTQLAIRDHANNASQNYKATVLEYSRADKWYKNLSNAYLKQWKKLK